MPVYVLSMDYRPEMVVGLATEGTILKTQAHAYVFSGNKMIREPMCSFFPNLQQQARL